ncbi:MAG: peptide deformylase [Lachnospiraceae bacterium]|nr:peptide deformylase [Lachnospiraceae bacterium]
MGTRNIREMGDPILKKKSKEVKEMTPRIQALIDDMFETMYEANGCGLAAVQVGVLKRIFVVDVTEDGSGATVFINPEIIETEGVQDGNEGCLSVPGKKGAVQRPKHVVVKALDEEMNEFILETDDLFARAICHENDHLDGILYVEKVHGPLLSSEVEESDEEEEEA